MENPKGSGKLKVAIVHDFLTYWGGAEQVLRSLHRLYPDAPIYTLLYDKSMDEYFPDARIRVSFLGKLPSWLKRRKKLLLPLMPAAAETFDLSGFDLVISSSSSFAKGRRQAADIAHILLPRPDALPVGLVSGLSGRESDRHFQEISRGAHTPRDADLGPQRFRTG